MNAYSFSPSACVFFANELKETLYVPAKAWPEDAKEVDNSIAEIYMTVTPPNGKTLGTDGELPMWVDKPVPSQDEMVKNAEEQRQTLLYAGREATTDWRAELELGIISDEDKELLIEWMKYIKALKAIDTSSTSGIEWPKAPE